MKKMNYTAIIEKSDDGWYVGQVQEIPEAIAQGKTIEELKQNLLDALELVIDFHREQTNCLYQGHKIIKPKLKLERHAIESHLQLEIRNTHINIGTGKEISIKALAELIAKQRATIIWFCRSSVYIFCRCHRDRDHFVPVF